MSIIRKRTEFLRRGEYGFFFHFINQRCNRDGGLIDPDGFTPPEQFSSQTGRL